MSRSITLRRTAAASVAAAGCSASLYAFSTGIDDILRCRDIGPCGAGYLTIALSGAGFVASIWLACSIWFKLPREADRRAWLEPVPAWLKAYRWKVPLVIAIYLAGSSGGSPWWVVPGALAMWTAEMDVRSDAWLDLQEADVGRSLLYWALTVAAFDAIATTAAAYMVGVAVAVASRGPV